MHAMHTNRTKRLCIPCSAAILIAAALTSAEARATEYGAVLRTGDPAFRTDLGVHLELGGASCVGGGSGYAKCHGTENQWDTSFGLQGGVIIRPFERFSFGMDLGFASLKYHQVTANTWRDFLLGPTARYHQPIRIRSVYFEPSVGLQAGYVYGVLHEEKNAGGQDLGYEHKHYGAFVSALVGLDFFPLPRLGIGFEFRLVRTFYTDVCFESADTSVCRGAQEKHLVDSDVRDPEGKTAQFLGDKGAATYPWKLFWGLLHVIYYL
jgi:hypothetical protein